MSYVHIQEEMNETQKMLDMHTEMTRQHIEFMEASKKTVQLFQENCVQSEMHAQIEYAQTEEDLRIRQEEVEKEKANAKKEACTFTVGTRVRKKSGTFVGECGTVERVIKCESYDIVIVRKDERKDRYTPYNQKKKGRHFSKQSAFNFEKL